MCVCMRMRVCEGTHGVYAVAYQVTHPLADIHIHTCEHIYLRTHTHTAKEGEGETKGEGEEEGEGGNVGL